MSNNKQELKIRALLERVSSLTAHYENQVADLRVELTVLTEQLEQATEDIRRLNEAGPDVVEAVPSSVLDDADPC